MAKIQKIFVVITLLGALASPAHSQNMEQRFQDLFITAGYSTAFGAAMGAAIMGLSIGSNNSTNSLDYIAQGASLGFIVGSALGSYVVFSPMFDVNIASTSSHNVYANFGVTPSQQGGALLAANFTWEHN
ncbi:MAG: hypothetical protein AB8C84_12335 [Oligoflexales bacterium]